MHAQLTRKVGPLKEATVCLDLNVTVVAKKHNFSSSPRLGAKSDASSPIVREGMILRIIGLLAIGTFLSILVGSSDLKFKPEFRPIDQIGRHVMP